MTPATSMKLELEFLTPGFLGGATARRVDPYMPVRPSAVRGALRAWFRMAAATMMRAPRGDAAAHGRVLSRVYEAEARVFGNTGRRSTVIIPPPTGLDSRCVQRYGKQLPDGRKWPGLRYLGYGAFGSDNIHFIAPPARFALTLHTPQPFAGLAELLSATVWLWLHLGGLGARVRRGFGSLQLQNAEGLLCPPRPVTESPAPGDVSTRLQEGVEWALAQFRTHLPKVVDRADISGAGATHPRLRTLAELSAITALPPPRQNAKDALEHVGRQFRDFRSTLQRRDLGLPPLPDYFAVKNALARGGTPAMAERAAFGLPLRYFFRSVHNKSIRVLPAEPRSRPGQRPRTHQRLASPLYFRVHPVAEPTGYVPVVFHFAAGKSPLLGLELVHSGDRGTIATPSGEILDQFIAWAQRESARQPTQRTRRPKTR